MRFTLCLSALTLPLATLGGPFIAKVEVANQTVAPIDLRRRFYGTRWTFYDVGLGACGINSFPSDFVVALNTAQYGVGYPGPCCFKKISMSANGKMAIATIVDACPGCPFGGLDLSRGLFVFFAPESLGIIIGDWNFI